MAERMAKQDFGQLQQLSGFRDFSIGGDNVIDTGDNNWIIPSVNKLEFLL